MTEFLTLFLPALAGLAIGVTFERIRAHNQLAMLYKLVSDLMPDTSLERSRWRITTSFTKVVLVDFCSLIMKGREKLKVVAADQAIGTLAHARTAEIQRLEDAHADKLAETETKAGTAMLRRVVHMMLTVAESVHAKELAPLRELVALDAMDLTASRVVGIYGKTVRDLERTQQNLRIRNAELEAQKLRTLRALGNVTYLCAKIEIDEGDPLQALVVRIRHTAERDSVLLVMEAHGLDYDRPEGYWLYRSRGIKEVLAMSKNPDNTFKLPIGWIKVFEAALAENERLHNDPDALEQLRQKYLDELTKA